MSEWFTFYGAVHLFVIQENKVLLLKRRNTGYEDGKYGVVAGKLEGNEEVIAATIREAKEESGIELEAKDVEVVGVMHRKSDNGEWIDFFLTSKTWRGVIVNAEPDKCSELTWFPFDSLPDNMIPSVRLAFENVRKGTWFASVGFG